MPAALPLVLLLALLAGPGAPLDGPRWQSFEDAVATGRQDARKVLVSVTASWCPWCARLDRAVYADPEVQAYLERHFVPGRLHYDGTEPVVHEGRSLPPHVVAFALDVEDVPGTVFFDEDGGYITVYPGYADQGEFLRVLRYIAEDAWEDESYEAFVARGG